MDKITYYEIFEDKTLYYYIFKIAKNETNIPINNDYELYKVQEVDNNQIYDLEYINDVNKILIKSKDKTRKIILIYKLDDVNWTSLIKIQDIDVNVINFKLIVLINNYEKLNNIDIYIKKDNYSYKFTNKIEYENIIYEQNLIIEKIIFFKIFNDYADLMYKLIMPINVPSSQIYIYDINDKELTNFPINKYNKDTILHLYIKQLDNICINYETNNNNSYNVIINNNTNINNINIKMTNVEDINNIDLIIDNNLYKFNGSADVNINYTITNNLVIYITYDLIV